MLLGVQIQHSQPSFRDTAAPQQAAVAGSVDSQAGQYLSPALHQGVPVLPCTTASGDTSRRLSPWQSLPQGHSQPLQGHASAHQRASSAGILAPILQQGLPSATATALSQAPLGFAQPGRATGPWQQHDSSAGVQQQIPQDTHSIPLQPPNVITQSSHPVHQSATIQSTTAFSVSHSSPNGQWHPAANTSTPQASWQTQMLQSSMPSSYSIPQGTWQHSSTPGMSLTHTSNPAADTSPCPWVVPPQHPQGFPVSNPTPSLTASPAVPAWAVPQPEAATGQFPRADAASRPASRCDHPLYAHLDLSRPLCLQQPAAFPHHGSMHSGLRSASSIRSEGQGHLQPQHSPPRNAAPFAPQVPPQQQLQSDAVTAAKSGLQQQCQQQRHAEAHAYHWQQLQWPQLPVSQQSLSSPEPCDPQVQEQRFASAAAGHLGQDAIPQQHACSNVGPVQHAASQLHLDRPFEGVVALFLWL